MTLNTKVTIPDTLFLQTIDDETILLDTVSQEYFTLNELGTIIWNLLEKNENLKDIQKEILEIYYIDEKKLESDILVFIQTLNEKGLIKID